MELSHLPVIDWDLGKKLAGNRPDLAKEILSFLVKRVSDDLALIKYLYDQGNQAELLRQIHKLHGALCYCGVPRLQILAGRLEMDLKSHIMTHLKSLLDQLEIEVAILLEHYTDLECHA